MKIALFEPEIPQNVGTIMRACACLNLDLILIEPLGFFLEDRAFKRAKLDYETNFEILDSWQTFIKKYENQRKILLTPHTSTSISHFSFHENDIIVFGRESNGMEIEIMQYMDGLVSIPMHNRARSLNIAVSFAMVCGHISHLMKLN